MNFHNKLFYLIPLIALSGCAINNETPQKIKWETKTAKTSTPIEITFKPRKAIIGSSAKSMIRTNITTPQETYFRIFGHNVGLSKSITALRLKKIISYLGTLGVPKDNIEVFEEAGDYKDSINTITLIIDHYQVVPPACPGWNQEMNVLIPPEGEINFGCATERNFAAMISDPRVITSGKKLGMHDANRSSKAIDNYRTDNIKKIKIEKIETNNGGQS